MHLVRPYYNCLPVKLVGKLQDKRILLLTEGRAEEQQLVIIQEQDGFHLCGDYDQVVQEEKIRQVIDDLNDRQNKIYDIVKERSAKDLPTTYKDVAALLEDIKDPERQARKTLTQLENHKLIIGNCKVRNIKLRLNGIGLISWFRNHRTLRTCI